MDREGGSSEPCQEDPLNKLPDGSYPEERVYPRPSLDTTMMDVARLMARRSTCLKRWVGCVVTTESGYVLSTGYNGAPTGMDHCEQVGCLIEDDKCVRSIHAEMNAILTAGRHGVSLVASTAYVTARPCLRCTVAMVQAGVERIVYDEPRADSSDRTAVWDIVREARILMGRLKR